MHLLDFVLFMTLVTPLALAGPRGNSFFRRTGDDDTDKDSTSTLSLTSIETFSMTSSPILVSVDQSSFSLLKDQSSTILVSSTSDKDKDAPPSTTSTSDKDKPTSTMSTSGQKTPTSGTSTSDNDHKRTSSAPAKDQTTSSSVSFGTFSSTTSMTILYETSPTFAPESTQEIVVTDVVYTTLTTCPITNTVTSGTSEVEKVTTSVSTLTLTSTSTLCTKCVAPPKSKPETTSTSAGATKTSSFAASVIYSLTELPSHLSSQASVSTKTIEPNNSGPPLILNSTLPKAPLTTAPAKSTSSQPEIIFFGTAVSSSIGLIMPSLVSSNVSATSITGPLVISGYSIVPPPTSIPEGPGPLSNASSTIIPVFSAPLLGNAYGGGFVATPSVYATKLASPNGPPEGYAPGYGFSSKPETSAMVNEILNSSVFDIPGPVETSLPSVPASVTIETSTPVSAIVNSSGFNVPGPVETSPSGVPTSVIIPGLSTMPAVGAPVSVSVASSTSALAKAPTSEAAVIISSALTNGTPVSIASATPLSEGQTSAAAQFSSTVLTPVVGVNGLTSLAVIQSTTVLASIAVGSPSANPSDSLIPSANGLTPVLGASGLSSVVVVPSPVVGQNGLTSLAVFSTPIAAANGLTSPAVVLTPVVGANGLTSLAVLATPVVGANGLTSLAIGLASEQATATPPLPNSVLSPSNKYALIGPAAAASGGQVGIAASPLSPSSVASSVLLGSSNFTSNGSGGNASVHVSLNPTPVAEFEGSARRMTLSCGASLVGSIIFVFLL